MKRSEKEELERIFNSKWQYYQGKGFACKCKKCKKLFWSFNRNKLLCQYKECMSERYHESEQREWKKVPNICSNYKSDSDANGEWSNAVSYL